MTTARRATLALDASKSDDAIPAGLKLSRIKFDQGSQIFTPEPFAAGTDIVLPV
jgi:hypothetical protein